MAFAITGALQARADTLTLKITGLHYNGKTGADADCPTSGADCEIDITIEYGVARSPNGQDWTLSGTITAGPFVDIGDRLLASPSSYTFPPGSSITITDGQFSGVPGQTFSLSGITTDSDGNFTVSNPVTQ